MKNFELLLAALALLAVAAGLAFYEWSRIKAGRPIMKGSQAVVMYWVAYLSLFVLGITTGVFPPLCVRKDCAREAALGIF